MRVELNALPSDQIISLIENALGDGEKVLPRDETLARAWRRAVAEAAARSARSAALRDEPTRDAIDGLQARVSRRLEEDLSL